MGGEPASGCNTGASGHHPQKPITDIVATGIIHLLEAVEVVGVASAA